MSNFHRTLRRSKAFTLVELLIVIVVLAVLAAIVIPKFGDSSLRGKEANLKSNLKVIRNAVDLFKADTGAFPAALANLSATAAPASGKDAGGTTKSITAADWKGPYLSEVPKDAVASAAFTYSVTSGTVGKVTPAATGTASDGTTYSTW